MADRACVYCEDLGDCRRCSYFFQRDEVHESCGILWGEHQLTFDPSGFYPPNAICKQKENADEAK